MAEFCNNLSFLDILHKPEHLPSVKKDSNSKCGITLSILFFLAYIGYEIFNICEYKNNFKLAYSQDFQETKLNINKKVTFGFRLADNLNDSIKLQFLNSTNHIIDDNLIKKCDQNLKEVTENVNSKNNYYCFIDYPIIGSGISNHIFEVDITYEGELKNINSKIILFMAFVEPRIKHNDDNPFDYSELNHLGYIFDIKTLTTYRKYIKIIDYKTEGFFKSSEENAAYLDEFEDINKNDIIDASYRKILGSFRFSLSKKKDIFERKYVWFLNYFINVICGNFVSLKALFEFITLILVNPNDNLRIYSSLNKKRPSLFNDTSKLIKDYWNKKNNNNLYDNDDIIIKKDFDCCDKIKLFCKCCRKDKKKYLIAVNDFIEDKLTISDTLENTIINDIKYNKFRDRISSIQIPNEYKDREYEYLENKLKQEFPNYEAEEIKVKIKEIIEEKNKNKVIPP